MMQGCSATSGQLTFLGSTMCLFESGFPVLILCERVDLEPCKLARGFGEHLLCIYTEEYEVALKFIVQPQCEEKLAHVNSVCGVNAVTLMMHSCVTFYNANLFALLCIQKWDVLCTTCSSTLSGLFNVAAASELTY